MFIDVRDLEKSYHKDKKVVDSISFSIGEGEIFGLLGPNGAGKSTTISMLATITKQDAGEIFIDGISAAQYPSRIKKLIGLVPQDIALYANMTARENLRFWGRMYGIRGRELKERVNDVLEIVGLRDRGDEQIGKYSGGMKRRINIGAALLHKPKFLIMDEPTVGIDPQSRNHILETVKRLSDSGMTILYTSHYMEEVEFLCDRIAIMDQGKVIAMGTKQELKDAIGNLGTIELKYQGETQGLEENLMQLENIHGVYISGDTVRITTSKGNEILMNVIAVMNQNGTQISSLDVSEANLESVFLKLTGKSLRD